MKYLEFFKEVQLFTNDSYILGGWYLKHIALEMFQKETGDITITENMIEENRVKFGYPPDFIEDREDFEGRAIWYSGANGKGSMTVWEYNPYDRIKI